MSLDATAGLLAEPATAGCAVEATSETAITKDVSDAAAARRTRCICNVLIMPTQNTRFVVEDDCWRLLMLLLYRRGAMRP